MSNETKTLKYFDIVKMIHPDWNPEIQNPTEKMEEATKYRNDESALYELAVKWGLIEDDSIELFDISNINYIVDRGKIVKINQQYEGIIIDFVNKGSLVDVIVWINGGFRSFRRKDTETQDNNFYIIGNADDDEYTKLDFKYQMMHGERQEG